MHCRPRRPNGGYRLMTAAPPKVFISYSHDSDEHAARVRKLANELRRDGVHAIIDQYFTSPPEGWPAWMDAHIRDDDFVVMVCTETYYRRVMRKEKPDVGHGVAWEGSLIYNHIYRDKCDLSRFVPVLLNGGSHDHIPDPLAGATYYLTETSRGYEGLLRQIFKRPEAQMPHIGQQPPLPQRTAQWTTHPPAAHPTASPVPPAIASTSEPVPPAGGAVLANGAVDAPAGVSSAIPDLEENKWVLVIEASFEDINPLVLLLTNKLRELSGDATLSIKRISPGSVVLELECSNKAGLRLYGLIAEGKLTEILGYKVQSIPIAPLIAALHDPDETIRKEAAKILGKLKVHNIAIAPLIAALHDPDETVQKEAAEVLGKLGDTRAVEPLLIAALKDDDWEVRRAAVGTLGQLRDGRAVPRQNVPIQMKRFSDSDLEDYVLHRMDHQNKAELEDRIQQDPALSQRLREVRDELDPLRQLGDILNEPLPTKLRVWLDKQRR
jgi:hypothetical protein